jgi:hypothetical protein
MSPSEIQVKCSQPPESRAKLTRSKEAREGDYCVLVRVLYFEELARDGGSEFCRAGGSLETEQELI